MAALEADAIDADVNGVYTCVMRGRPHTVVETPAYLTAVQSVLSEAERADVVTMVAENPEAGVSLFLLTVFAKNEKTDLSARERTALIAAAKQMVEDYRRRQ